MAASAGRNQPTGSVAASDDTTPQQPATSAKAAALARMRGLLDDYQEGRYQPPADQPITSAAPASAAQSGLAEPGFVGHEFVEPGQGGQPPTDTQVDATPHTGSMAEAGLMDEVGLPAQPGSARPDVVSAADCVDRSADDGWRSPAELADRREARTKAMNAAVRKLAAAPASSQQVRQALLGKGHVADVVDEVIDQLESSGVLNDAEYAEMATRAKVRQAKARPVIRRELRDAGVTAEIITEATAELTDADEHQAAAAYVAKKLPGLLRHDDQVIQRRLLGQLARRGYSQGVSWAVIKEALRDR